MSKPKKPRKEKPRKEKPRKPQTHVARAIRLGIITPERGAKAGTLEPVGGHEATGRGEVTYRVKDTPIEFLFYKAKRISDIQYAAGCRLYELYVQSRLDPTRAADYTRPYVDGAGSVSPEWNERARSDYARAIKALDNPMVYAMIKAVVIEEQSVSFVPQAHYKAGSGRASAHNLAILELGLDILAATFGMTKATKGLTADLMNATKRLVA